MTLAALNPHTWRLSVRVPLLVAALVLVAVLSGVSKLLLDKLAREQGRPTGRALGETYLDGLSSALMPAVIRRDIWETFDALDRAKSLYAGLETKWVAVLVPNGTVLAASDPILFPVGSHLTPDIDAHRAAIPLVIDGRTETAWLSRGLRQDGADVGWVLARINISANSPSGARHSGPLVGIDLALALAFAAPWMAPRVSDVGSGAASDGAHCGDYGTTGTSSGGRSAGPWPGVQNAIR